MNNLKNGPYFGKANPSNWKFMQPNILKIRLDIVPGEIVQILETMPDECDVKMNHHGKLYISKLTPQARIPEKYGWSFSSKDTIYTLVTRWLADVPILSVMDVLCDFGLDEVVDLPIQEAEIDTCFRLQTLYTILQGPQIIQMVSLWKIHDATDFVLNAHAFALEQARDRFDVPPAFLLFDSDALPGLTLVANRVLLQENNQIRELAVYY